MKHKQLTGRLPGAPSISGVRVYSFALLPKPDPKHTIDVKTIKFLTGGDTITGRSLSSALPNMSRGNHPKPLPLKAKL